MFYCQVRNTFSKKINRSTVAFTYQLICFISMIKTYKVKVPSRNVNM